VLVLHRYRVARGRRARPGVDGLWRLRRFARWSVGLGAVELHGRVEMIQHGLQERIGGGPPGAPFRTDRWPYEY